MSKDDMGDPKNITLQTLAQAAIASNMSAVETIEEMKKSLQNLKPEELEKEIGKQSST